MLLRKRVINAINILAKHPLVKRKLISPAIIKQWLIDTHKVDPERLEWHARRCLSIGGSDIYKAVQFYLAVQASAKGESISKPFLLTSVQDVVKGKILLSTPEPQNHHTRRGILNEPLARSVFINKLRQAGRVVVEETAISEALKQYRSDIHPWFAYNDDDVLTIDGQLTLIDYKCPAPDETYSLSSKVEPDYEHQLHLGAWGLKQLGHSAQLLLVKYNVIEADTIAIPVPFDIRTAELNLTAGDYLYNNYILHGKVPEYQPSLIERYSLAEVKDAVDAKLVLPEASQKLIAHMRQLAFQFAISKAMESKGEQLSVGYAEQMAILADQIGMEKSEAENVLAIGPVELKKVTKKTSDQAKIIDFAIAKGIDLTAHQRSVTNMDSLLVELKEKTSTAEYESLFESSENTSVILTKKKKGPAAALKTLFQTMAESELLNVSELLSKQTTTLESLDDAVSVDIFRDRARQQHFVSIWENAINTYISSQQTSTAISDFLDEIPEDDAFKPM